MDQEDTEPPHIKEEQEELWINQEGEQPQELEKFPFAVVVLKTEEDEAKPQPSQLYQIQTETMETEDDGVDSGGTGSARNSDPERHSQPEIEVKTEDSSEPETEDSSEPETEDSDDYWKETGEHQSGAQQLWSPGMDQEDVKPPHIKEEQEELWISQECELQGLEKAKTTKFPFTVVTVKIDDKVEKPQSSQLHQGQTKQMETGADGKECVGTELAWTSDSEGHSQPEIEVKIEDSSETDTAESDDDWKETRECRSGLTSEENVKGTRPDTRNKLQSYRKRGGAFNHKGNLETGEKPFSCSECGKTFKDKQYLSTHVRTHTGEKPYECSFCGKKFNRKGTLNNHILVHTGEKPFSCSECGKSFVQKSYLTLHMAYHRGDKRYSCSVCKQRFSWHHQLKRHKCLTGQASERHQNQTEEKDDCGGAESDRNSEVKTEDSSEQGERCTEHSCSKCGKTFKENQDLTTHMKIHIDKPFSCSVCCKRFQHKGILTKHMIIHTGEKPFCCSECGKRFRHKQHLVRHNLVHTGEKPFGCTECGNRFTQKPSLEKHMALHRREKLYSCSVCGEKFFFNHQLKKHKCAGGDASELYESQPEEKREAETGVDGEDFGGAESQKSSGLERHLQLETEVKTEDSFELETHHSEDYWKATRDDQSGLNFVNFKDLTSGSNHSCSECGKAFKCKWNMIQHMLVHTREKPFSCTECGKRFTSKRYLTLHLANHSGEKPFGCFECGKAFSWHHQLKKHKCVCVQASELHQTKR